MDTPEKRVEPAQVRRLPFDPYTGKPYPPPDEDQQSERCDDSSSLVARPAEAPSRRAGLM